MDDQEMLQTGMNIRKRFSAQTLSSGACLPRASSAPPAEAHQPVCVRRNLGPRSAAAQNAQPAGARHDVRGQPPARITHPSARAIANGCSKEEIREVLLQVAIYCGIPASLDAHDMAMRCLRR